MNRKTFIRRLSRALRALPQKERETSIAYYEEMIDDRMEAGMSEEEAVEALGPVGEVAEMILENLPHDVQTARIGTLEVVLLALGSPIWLSLLIVAAALAFSAAVTIAALIVTLYAVLVGLALSAPLCLISAAWQLLEGSLSQALMGFGKGCLCGGLFLMFLPLCKRASAGLIWLCRQAWQRLKCRWLERRFAR